MTFNSSHKRQALAALVGEGGQCHYIQDETSLIGRVKDAFICLENKCISRTQCVLVKTADNKITICDKSSGGTFVNGKRLVKNAPQELHHHDQITFNDTESFPFIFLLNKKLKESNEQIRTQMEEKMLSLDCSHFDKMKELNQKICQLETEKSELNDVMNSKLEVQEQKLKAERTSLSNLVASSHDLRCEVESKLKEAEALFKVEKDILQRELESKITDINNKEIELQQIKKDLELCHQKEREELEERCRSEIEELKEKLAQSKMDNNRFQEEVKEVGEKLKETKQVLIDCELEQNRLIEEKVEMETKLESKIQDLAKESTSKDQAVEDLKRKLQEKKEKDYKMIKDMEETLQCGICTELFIDSTVLNCGHLFCKYCIEEWQSKKKICPMCRTKITSTMRLCTMDAIVERHLMLLPKDTQVYHQELVKQRREANQPPKKKKKQSTKRNRIVMEVQLGGNGPDVRNLPTSSNRPNHNHMVPFVPLSPFQPLEPPAAHDNDPFALQFHGRRRRGRRVQNAGLVDRLANQSAATAIDLTHLDSPVIVPSPSTSSFGRNVTIDLTSPQ